MSGSSGYANGDRHHFPVIGILLILYCFDSFDTAINFTYCCRSLDLCWIIYMDGKDDYVPDVDVLDSQLEGSTVAGCSDYAALYEGKRWI